MMINIIITILAVLWFVILLLTFLHWKNDPPYITRTRNWFGGQLKEVIEAKKASLFDFSSFSAAIISVLGLAVGWYTITQQNDKSALDQQARDLTDQISQHKHLLDQLQETRAKSHDSKYVRLGLPGRDAKVIGEHVDISWDYPEHTSEMTYKVEVITKRQDATLGTGEACQDRSDPAHDSPNQQTHLSGTDKCPLEGKYLWRVAPLRFYEQRDSSTNPSPEEWSEYGSFEIYPTIQKRVLATNTVLVGTTYSEDDTFSGRAKDGKPHGHDMDFIELLVRGCIKRTGDETLFDDKQCDANIKLYMDNVTDSDGRYRYQGQAPQLDVHVVPYESVDEGLRALSRRETDVFIGSVTKAKRRERGLVFFSRGYFTFHSGLFVRTASEPFSLWSGRKQTVGVISNSTNHWLGTQLTTEGGSDNRITLVTFENFLGLEKAFEDGDIDGAVVDCMLQKRLVDSIPIDLQNTDAWTGYLHDPDNLGYGVEKLGIAMVRDATTRGVDDAHANHVSWWPAPNDKIKNKIQSSLEQALDHVLATPELMRELRVRNRVSTTIPGNCALDPKPTP
jgi:ABC-type amino acid transport substrate-binding protein